VQFLPVVEMTTIPNSANFTPLRPSLRICLSGSQFSTSSIPDYPKFYPSRADFQLWQPKGAKGFLKCRDGFETRLLGYPIMREIVLPGFGAGEVNS
jgi:hypothetical protein